MADRRVPVVASESDTSFASNLFSYRVFGSVKVGDKDWPAALEKTGKPLLWTIEFFQHDAPWSTMKSGDDITFSVGPKHRVNLKVGEHATEVGVPDA